MFRHNRRRRASHFPITHSSNNRLSSPHRIHRRRCLWCHRRKKHLLRHLPPNKANPPTKSNSSAPHRIFHAQNRWKTRFCRSWCCRCRGHFCFFEKEERPWWLSMRHGSLAYLLLCERWKHSLKRPIFHSNKQKKPQVPTGLIFKSCVDPYVCDQSWVQRSMH